MTRAYQPSASDDFTPPGAWAARGACLDQDEHVDQIPSGNGFKPNARAVLICNGCEAEPQCLKWVMSHREEPLPGMVAGGLYSHERRHIRAMRG